MKTITKVSYTLFVDPKYRDMCKLQAIKFGIPENEVFVLAMKLLKKVRIKKRNQ